MDCIVPPSTLVFLSRLWLQEPDVEALEQARQIPAFAPHCAEPADPSTSASLHSGLRLRAGLAAAYADLFLLNVYPYASVFLDPDGEMNGARAQEVRDIYAQYGYAPGALHEVGAADHVGLMLGLLAQAGHDGHSVLPYLLDWAPVLCLAVEREPAAACAPFYRAVASETRRVLFEQRASFRIQPAPALHGQAAELELEWARSAPDEELSLRAIVHRLLCPARSGVFLSRARLGAWARDLGVRLPFASRFDVGLSLFEAAGAMGHVSRLVDGLMAELEEWDATYAAWARAGWGNDAVAWRARVRGTIRMLASMKETLVPCPP